jgi:hypothetical protein
MHSTLLARISTQLKGRVKAITSAVPTDNPVSGQCRSWKLFYFIDTVGQQRSD